MELIAGKNQVQPTEEAKKKGDHSSNLRRDFETMPRHYKESWNTNKEEQKTSAPSKTQVCLF